MSKKSLTPKQQLFIKNYLIFKNASKAARIAGYSAKTARSAGSRLLTNVDISTALEKGLAEQLEKADINADHIIAAIKRIAFGDIYNRSYSGNLRALELLGKTLGLFQDKTKRY